MMLDICFVNAGCPTKSTVRLAAEPGRLRPAENLEHFPEFLCLLVNSRGRNFVFYSLALRSFFLR
jgi:hypothetical protein